MRKFCLALIVCVALLATGPPSYAGNDMGLTGDEFLTRLANVFFRVRYGFSNDHVMNAEHGEDRIVLSYDNTIFVVIKETPPPREIKNISAVFVTNADEAGQLAENPSPGGNIVYEDICKQIMYALNPALRDADVKGITKALGIRGEALDGVQRSIRSGGCKYITKYNENGMLIMVVSGL